MAADVQAALQRLRLRERRAERDRLREQRLDEVTVVVDRLVFDLARLSAGHSVAVGSYMSAALTKQLHTHLRPFLATGDVMHPDFGSYAELRVEGDLLRVDVPVAVTVEFDDCSARESAAGQMTVPPRRHVTIRARVSVADHSVDALTVQTDALP